MPRFESQDRVPSGMPLGGLGAGKIELLPNGLFNGFTFLNNWSQPIEGNGAFPGILGYHLGVSAETRGKRKACLLQTVPVAGAALTKKIVYEGIFPKVSLAYDLASLGLEASLEAFSPWIPGDVKHSSLPCAFFTFRVRNTTKHPVRAGFLFMGRNICGEWNVGRRNRIVEEADRVHLEFSTAAKDPRTGSLRFGFDKKGWKISFMESWNGVKRNFYFDRKDLRLDAWDRFRSEGRLNDSKPRVTVEGENHELMGAVCAHRTLRAGQEASFYFIAAWHFASNREGHRYGTWFKDAALTGRYAVSRRAQLQRSVDRLHEIVFSMPFPGWFNDALLANLTPFFASSWYVRDGRFVFYEAPKICPLMGTVDVGFYGSIPLAYFFPKLEMSQIEQFARVQRPDGYIPHDLGKNRIDLASNGTTYFLWKDLNPKFVLMAYRDFLWSGDRAFLRRLYPSIKRAMQWSFGTDTDGNGLPDNEGADQTFDLWDVRGTHAYTSGIFLAALLAAERSARQVNDARFTAECRERFLRGRFSFEKELWNGKCFGDPCSLSQLNGQWYADLLGLGTIADPLKIRRALAYILKANARHSRYGLVNSVHTNGRLDTSNKHSRNIWSGMNHAFLCLCLTQGFALNDLLKPARRLWDNVTREQKNPWNQPDMLDSKSGRYVFGDFYYRNMALWSIPIAHAMTDPKTARALSALCSMGRAAR